jgi:hypothetical protein
MKNIHSSRHIENGPIVKAILKKLFSNQDNNIRYRDIMNSFWNTYKFFLQIEYPAIFPSIKYLKNKEAEYNRTPSTRKPPLHSGNSAVIREEYIKYYNTGDFGKEIEQKIKSISGQPVWCEFLLQNFDSFQRVHQCGNLQKFAKLTHTIGNILSVPKGFNVEKANKNYDYCDSGLELLKNEILACSGSFREWKCFVVLHYLDGYVDKDYDVIPLWEDHELNNPFSLVQDSVQINKFLSNVNCRIINRGKYLIKNLCEKTHCVDYEFYKIHLRDLPLDPEFGDELICTETDK